MLLPPFGFAFSEAFASNFKVIDMSIKQVSFLF